MLSCLQDFGIQVPFTVQSDASAAIGIVKREGLGKVRHLAVADLWVQQQRRLNRIQYRKLHGKDNPADLMTKTLAFPDIGRHLTTLGVKFLTGRSALAPQRGK